METYRETAVTIPTVSLDPLIAILSEDDPKAAGELLLREQPNLIETLGAAGPSMNSKELSGRQHFAIPQSNGARPVALAAGEHAFGKRFISKVAGLAINMMLNSSRLEVPETAKW